jgi:hypothetical protein
METAQHGRQKSVISISWNCIRSCGLEVLVDKGAMYIMVTLYCRHLIIL